MMTDGRLAVRVLPVCHQSLINRNALILTKFYMEYFFRLSSRNNFLLSDISCLSKRQIKFCCQSFIFYTNLAKYYIFHGSSKKLRIASSINKQISNILHSFLFRCRMSMNDKMMILSSDFTGYIKRFLGNLTHECQQGELVSISLGLQI